MEVYTFLLYLQMKYPQSSCLCDLHMVKISVRVPAI